MSFFAEMIAFGITLLLVALSEDAQSFIDEDHHTSENLMIFSQVIGREGFPVFS